jgi:glutaconate CoA-transferase, subunit B
MGFDEESKRMTLLALQPGVRVEDVQENTGFELLVPQSPARLGGPSQEELEVVRRLDPEGVFLG